MTIVTIPNQNFGLSSAWASPKEFYALAAADTLGLREAVLAWCDAELVQTFLNAGSAFRRNWRAGHPDPFPDAVDMRHAEHEMMQGRQSGHRHFSHARGNLIDDFKRRVGAGDLMLTGLRMLPDPATSLMTVPTVWLTRLDFNWAANTVRFGPDVLIVDVTVRRRGEGVSAKPRPKGGRPPFPLSKMIEIARVLPRASNNKVTARNLLAEFTARWPGVAPPEERTVYDHVAEVYARAATNARSPSP